MNAAAPEFAVRTAAPELTTLAVTVRPDWNSDVVAGILRQAADKGMPWRQVLVTLPRLMADPAAQPGDLLPRSPLQKNDVKPGAWERGAALARQMLDAKLSGARVMTALTLAPDDLACGSCGGDRGTWEDGARGDYCRTCYARWVDNGFPGFSPPAPRRAGGGNGVQAGRAEQYAQLRSWGLTRAEAALRMGVCRRTLRRYERALEAGHPDDRDQPFPPWDSATAGQLAAGTVTES